MAGVDVPIRTRLNTFCQRSAGKVIAKGDVEYKSEQIDGLWSSTVILHCLGGDTYEGEMSTDQKVSLNTAAAAALEAHADQVASQTSAADAKRATEGPPAKKKKATEGKGKGKVGKLGAPLQVAAGKGSVKVVISRDTQNLAAQAWATANKAFGKGGDKTNGKTKSPGANVVAAYGKAGNGKTKSPGANVVAAYGKAGAKIIVAAVSAPGQKKCELNQSLQTFLKRPVTKTDVEYVCEQVSEGYQATVTLHCLDASPAFIGEPAEDQKSAEALAAIQAINAYAEEFGQARAEKRKAPGATGTEPIAKVARAQPVVKVVVPAADLSKQSLQGKLSKIIRRPLVKGEIAYDTAQVDEGGWQSSVTASALPDEWASQQWFGDVSADRKQAENSAAAYAAACLDAEFAEAMTADHPQKSARYRANLSQRTDM